MQVVLEHLGAVLLMLAAVGWYISVMLATVAMTSSGGGAGGRAKAVWVCTIPVVLLGLAVDRHEIVIGMIFATSVACMTLVLGIVTLAAGRTTPHVGRKPWGMLLPVSLVCLLIGLSGGFDWKDAIILLVQGAAIYWMWDSSSDGAANAPAPVVVPRRTFVIIGAVVVATLAGEAAVLACENLSPRLGLMNAGMVTALMLAPAMVVPLIGLGLQAVQDGKYDEFVSGLVGYVLLNICLLLPIATLLWLSQPPQPVAIFDPNPTTIPATTPVTRPATLTTSATTQSMLQPRTALPYPMAVWRVDTVLLVAVGLLLLPVSMGRWSLGTAEALGLVLTWAAFMVLTVIVTLTHWL